MNITITIDCSKYNKKNVEVYSSFSQTVDKVERF